MPKKTALLDAINGAVSSGASTQRAKRLPETGSLGSHKDTRPHRLGLVNVTGYFDPAVKSSIRAIQMKHPKMTQQDILEEALEDIFAKYEVSQTVQLHKHTGKKEKA
jgi:hypothetical protein